MAQTPQEPQHPPKQGERGYEPSQADIRRVARKIQRIVKKSQMPTDAAYRQALDRLQVMCGAQAAYVRAKAGYAASLIAQTEEGAALLREVEEAGLANHPLVARLCAAILDGVEYERREAARVRKEVQARARAHWQKIAEVL